MNENSKKSKRICSRNNERTSIRQKLRNENEKRRRDLFNQLIRNIGDIIFGNEMNASNEEKKLSKNSILRQTVSFLREQQDNLRNYCSSNENCQMKDLLDLSWKPPSDLIKIEEWFNIAIESMNCFFLILNFNSNEGIIEYVSNNISSYLNYSKDQIEKNCLFQFINSLDHQILKDYFQNDHQVLKRCNIHWKNSLNNSSEECTFIGAFRKIKENEKYFFSIVKMNTLDRTLIIKTNSSFNQEEEEEEEEEEEFVTHINPNGRFIYINSKTSYYLGYNQIELIGKTFFHFVHPDDLQIISLAHQQWKRNLNLKSDPFRFLTRGEQWIYLRTSSQVKINSWTGKPQFYICRNYLFQWKSFPIEIRKSFQIDEETVRSEMLNSSNDQNKIDSTENEITSFLSDLDNENNRQTIREKLIELRKSKESEIRIRQDEIGIVDDLITFINQYQIKQQISTNQTEYILTDEMLTNFLDSNSIDFNVNDNQLTNHFENETNSLNDSLFSPLSLIGFDSSSIRSYSSADPLSNDQNTKNI